MDPFAQADQEAAQGENSFLDDEVLDLSDIEAVAGNPLIPNGTYPARVDKAAYKLSSNGNRMFSLQWLVQLPDHEDYTYRVFQSPTLSEKQAGQTKHQLNVITNGEINWQQFHGPTVAQQLIGCEAQIQVRQNTRPDNPFGESMDVQRVLPAKASMGGFAN